MDIIKAAGLGDDDLEDLGRISEAVLDALALQPGQFMRT
jgi:hypothetical protein